jgi:hypothetical protein
MAATQIVKKPMTREEAFKILSIKETDKIDPEEVMNVLFRKSAY